MLVEAMAGRSPARSGPHAPLGPLMLRPAPLTLRLSTALVVDPSAIRPTNGTPQQVSSPPMRGQSFKGVSQPQQGCARPVRVHMLSVRRAPGLGQASTKRAHILSLLHPTLPNTTSALNSSPSLPSLPSPQRSHTDSQPHSPDRQPQHSPRRTARHTHQTRPAALHPRALPTHALTCPPSVSFYGPG
jgi:hypothetical protein